MSIIDGSVKDHQPIDSATGITNSEFGTKAMSVNMKNTATYLRSQITRSFTTASKKLDAAKVYMDDPDINRNERELRAIDLLRKEIMMFLSIIETDSHFFEIIQTREVILSDKERAALKEVVTAHFAGKPRADTVQDLKMAQQALHDILLAQNFKFEPILSDAEMAELSRELESFLDGENDDDKQDDGPIRTKDEEPGNRHFQSQQADTPTITAAPPAVSTASITMSVPINGGLSGIPTQPVASPRTTTPLHRNLVNVASLSDPPIQHGINSIPLSQGADIEKCPCCSQAHKLYDCESRSIQKFCAQSGRCIYCTSDQHRSIECDLATRGSTPAPSTVGNRSKAGTRFVHPRNASTPHGIDHVPLEQPEYSWRGASRRERLNKSMMNDLNSATEPLHKDLPHTEESDESSENEWTEAKDFVKKRDNSVRLPFKDVDAIIKPFEDEPKDYHRFTNMIQNMVISNSRLNDTMKFVLLEKKLVGKAKRYLIELNDPRAALMETMKSIHRAFSQDNSAVNSILRKFQELTFNSVDYTQTTEELDHCKALILQMQEYGVDVDSDVCVRSLISRIPRKIMQEMRIFYRKGKKPTLSQVIDCFTDVLEDLTFPDRFTTDSASTKGRTKELTSTVMAMVDVGPQIPPQTPKQPAKEHPQKNKNASKPSSSNESKKSSNTQNNSKPKNENAKTAAGKNKNTQSKPNGNATQKSENNQQQVNVSDASAVYQPVNVGYTGYHPPHPQYNNPSYFPVYPNIGSPVPQNWNYGQNSNGGQGSSNNQSTKKGNPGNSARQNSKNTKVAKGPAPLPLGVMIGEQLEPCYNSGIGWDKNFIPHTFCRTDQTPNKCCFICGPGHSILQCPLPSFQVRKFLRDSNACHNCTKQGHATEDCQSKATCAYCQGKHNTGGCVFKEFYRDINNYPADAPRPVLGTFFRGPKGANE